MKKIKIAPIKYVTVGSDHVLRERIRSRRKNNPKQDKRRNTRSKRTEA